MSLCYLRMPQPGAMVRRPDRIAAATALFMAFIAFGSAAAPPFVQLSVERILTQGPGGIKADFTVWWNCGTYCAEIDYFNIRWGRKGEAGTQTEIPREREKWSTSLTAPGVAHVFKVQSCSKPAFSVGPIRPGGSSCSKWSEVELLLPAPPFGLSTADETDRDANPLVYHYRLRWQPGAGVTWQNLVVKSGNVQSTPKHIKLDQKASDTVVMVEPGDAVEVNVCGYVQSYESDLDRSRTGGRIAIGCTALAKLSGEIPPPRKPRIGAARNLGRQVRVDWEAADNFTDRYEVERLHRPSPNIAVVPAPGTQRPRNQSLSSQQEQGLRDREAVPLVKEPARLQPQQSAASSSFIWAKISPINQGYTTQDCSGYMFAGPMPSTHCMRDDPAKYARDRLGAPVTPYQYRICGVNKSGRTCSDFVAIPALYEAITESASAGTPPSLGSPTTGAARSRVPGLTPETPVVQVTPGMALDAAGRPISPTPQKPNNATAVTRVPPTSQSASLGQQAAVLSQTPSAHASGQQALARPEGASSRTTKTGQSTAHMYRSRPTGSASECQRACQADALCKAWTWVKPQAQVNEANGTCRLSNVSPVPGGVADACCVSGTR